MENYSFENIRVLVGNPNREVRDGNGERPGSFVVTRRPCGYVAPDGLMREIWLQSCVERQANV